MPKSIFLQFNTIPAVRESRWDKLSRGFRSTCFLHVPAISVPIPEPLSCFFAERGRFAQQTLKRSDRVCVRNAPRSKLTSVRYVLFWQGHLMLTSVSMTSVWRSGALPRNKSGAGSGGERPLEGVESNAVRTRGTLPPHRKACFYQPAFVYYGQTDIVSGHPPQTTVFHLTSILILRIKWMRSFFCLKRGKNGPK